ncbi:hypothetical protein LTR33_012128, partial [Friedmanniomyces endolithicus]
RRSLAARSSAHSSDAQQHRPSPRETQRHLDGCRGAKVVSVRRAEAGVEGCQGVRRVERWQRFEDEAKGVQRRSQRHRAPPPPQLHHRQQIDRSGCDWRGRDGSCGWFDEVHEAV